MLTPIKNDIINEEVIESALRDTQNVSGEKLLAIVEKSKKMKGLEFAEVAALLNSDDEDVTKHLFEAAKFIKDTIYGDRLVLFAPLYISNLCGNDCTYCAFRKSNRGLVRRALTQDEIRNEVETLVDQGHKRVLLVAGEAYPNGGFQYILDSIKTVYSVKKGKGEIRRLNVNIAPIEPENFVKLKASGIGTYQLFQETYHHETYRKVHLAGRKTGYDLRIAAIDKAFEAGIDDVGVGVLFGLYDYRFEVLALMQHIHHLEEKYDVGPHTISVPRLEPAEGAPLSENSPHMVTDSQFKKVIAILRISVPYTGLILSTRENPQMRRDALSLGVSQISAGSRTNPGAYAKGGKVLHDAQFSLGDHRSLDEVIRDVAGMGYIPSFCTACYRLGRTGKDFMEMAKPGLIKYHCSPNALSTYMEYLIDYASPETREAGFELIRQKIEESGDPKWKEISQRLIDEVKSGRRDCFV